MNENIYYELSLLDIYWPKRGYQINLNNDHVKTQSKKGSSTRAISTFCPNREQKVFSTAASSFGFAKYAKCGESIRKQKRLYH